MVTSTLMMQWPHVACSLMYDMTDWWVEYNARARSISLKDIQLDIYQQIMQKVENLVAHLETEFGTCWWCYIALLCQSGGWF